MPEVQNPEGQSPDPRWIMLRVSRINLGICVLGVLLAFPMMWVVSAVPVWIRVALLAAFLFSMALDLRLVLLKGKDSVGAFYLFDLDRNAAPAAPDVRHGGLPAGKEGPRLGIRIRLADTAKNISGAEREGVVLPGSFVSPWFTALRYRLPEDAAWRRWWPRVIPLWTDSLEAAAFRRTRVALKWK